MAEHPPQFAEEPRPPAVDDIPGEDRLAEGNGHSPVAIALAPSSDEQPTGSNFADDPLTRLWQGADDRDTGHEAVEALRARQRNTDSASEEKSRRRRPDKRHREVERA
jgi:hypothetical protein